ncbi:hypothetical protein [Sulfurimonas paralvinellae]|uniref:Uncharacterized protein n=1 Tax=Sulfurimonas paralvinellae TaxID=317658 RepID=A0A7M1B784_9BACT|nr:hypothetical protein [Sulfurimonas paralvinellae]QOP45551.1 hypothetical protein FM071_04335 [Sulfurimonas paralvinellae]
MKAIDIATEYCSKNIRYSEDIFLIDEIFEDACFWARESCREMFQTNSMRIDLVRKIDDVGAEVDRYMHGKRFKMLKNAKQGKNSLCLALISKKATIKWFVQRWINIFMNITTNPKYKTYIDIGSIGLILDENFSHDEDALALILKEEEKCEQKEDIEKWEKDLINMVNSGQFGGEATESGGTQIFLIF